MKPLNDWILVRLEPLPEKVGALFRVHGERVRTGVVLEVGLGVRHHKSGRRIPVGLEKGERIAFFREHLEHQQGKQIVHRLQEVGDDLGLIRSMDVLFVIAPGTEITVTA